MNPLKDSPSQYEIRVEGILGEMWTDWFEGLSIRNESEGEGSQPISVIYGLIPDQPALHGLIARIRDLNLPLISVRKIS